MNTVAAACIPLVLLNISIINPVANPKSKTNHLGVSIGNRRINKI
jgi:hypothetical protein